VVGLLAVVMGAPPAIAQRSGQDPYEVADLRRLQETFATIAERYRPSVVAIRTYRTLSRRRVSGTRVPIRVSENQGSGLIIRPDGYIVTNEHVVADSDKIDVVLYNGEFYDGVVLGSDRRSDLAVIKIDADNLRPVRFGDVSRVRPGHWSFSFGNPYGLANEDGETAFSVGNVSALGKSLSQRLDPSGERYYGNLIQTSSPINPGNSGGPLFNIHGEVIGVCTAMLSSSGANEGLGFAIPISGRTRQIIDTLRRGEDVRYGFLGVKIVDPNRGQRVRSGVKTSGGAFVTGLVGRNGPAERAGLQTNDMIVEFDSVKIDDSDHLIRVVGGTPIATDVPLVYYRAGARRQTRVRLGERPSQVAQVRPEADPPVKAIRWYGALLGEPTDAVLSAAGLTRADAGLVVVEIDSGKLYRAGLREEAIVMFYNDERVRSIAEFEAADRRARGRVRLTLADDSVIRFRK
jgi:serine protease Do